MICRTKFGNSNSNSLRANDELTVHVAHVRFVGVVLAEVDGIKYPGVETGVNAAGNLT